MDILQLSAPEPIGRISPSRFFYLMQCPLREAWNANHVPPILPVHPSARLGSVIHRFLESASKGVFKSLDSAWEMALKEVEHEMSAGKESALVPLRENAKRYEIKKRLAFSTAEKIFENRGCISTSTVSETAGAEVWLESSDKLVGGFVDRIRRSNDSVELIEYKTGAVTEQETGEVKAAFVVQILIYAALYHEQTGNWPDRLAVSILGGHKLYVEVNKRRALNLLQEARSTLSWLNKQIRSDDAIINMARPNENTCIFCVYRPACSSYWNARTLDRIWPADIRGTISAVTQLGNGNKRIVINDTAGQVVVSGVPENRYEFLSRNIYRVMFCNLEREKVERVFKPKRLTTGFVLT